MEAARGRLPEGTPSVAERATQLVEQKMRVDRLIVSGEA
jgi:hypothetical protein